MIAAALVTASAAFLNVGRTLHVARSHGIARRGMVALGEQLSMIRMTGDEFDAMRTELEQERMTVATLKAELELMREELSVAVAERAASELRAKAATFWELQENGGDASPEQDASSEGSASAEDSDEDKDSVSLAFDAVDENHDGVLTLEEFRQGYTLLTGDAVAAAFDMIDDNGDGMSLLCPRARSPAARLSV